MKKEFFYQTQLGRGNAVRDTFFAICMFLISPTRLLLEVFIRKNFGVRYFNLMSALLLAIFLTVMPIWLQDVFGTESFWATYTTWYLFVVGFLYVSIIHAISLKKAKAHVFDMNHYSLSRGTWQPFFRQMPGFATASIRTIEIWLEPAPFFILGAILLGLGQPIGGVLVFCSFFYSVGFSAAYTNGDHHVYNLIDNKILAMGEKDFFKASDEELKNGVNNPHGIHLTMSRPEAITDRLKMVEVIAQNEEFFEAD